MSCKVYKSRIDIWVYVLLVLSVGGCFILPAINGEPVIGIIIAGSMAAIWAVGLFGVKYEIRGNKLGIRNLFKWIWIPIDKISEVKKTKGYLAGAASSSQRVSIKISDRKILNSSMPVEISPCDIDGFIDNLLRINPSIKISA